MYVHRERERETKKDQRETRRQSAGPARVGR